MAPSKEQLLAQLGWLQDLAVQLVGDRHLAEDLAQQTCVVALQRRPRSQERLRQWLAAILRNFARQDARSERARQQRERRAVRSASAPSTLDTLERASSQHELLAAVLRLNEAYRTAVLLRFFDGLPQREIAKRTGASVATVNSRLTRALAQLRTDLDRRYGDERKWLAAMAPLLARPRGAGALGILVMNTKLKLAAWGAGVASVVAVLFGVFGAGDGSRSPEPGPPVGAAPIVAADAGSPPGSRAGADRAQRTAVAGERADAADAPFTVTGVVVDGDGRPATGVTVAFESGGTGAATSDAEGRFELATRASAGTVVTASRSHTTVLSGEYARDSSIEPVVVAAPKLQLGGTVANEAGQGLPSAHVRLHLPADFERRFRHSLDRSRRIRWQTTAGDGGRFSLSVPQIAGSYLQASLEPYASTVEPAPSFTDDQLYLVMRRPSAAGPTVRGRVVDAAGGAVPEARVALGLTSVVTDDHGGFELQVNRGGPAERLVAVKPGHLPATYRRDRDEPWPPFVELRLEGEALSIGGRVLGLDGEPVANALVWALDTSRFGQLPVALEYLSAGGVVPPGMVLELPVLEDRPQSPVSNSMNHARAPSAAWFYDTTDSDGRFTLPGLTPKRYRVRAMHPDTVLMATSQPCAAGTGDLVVRMPVEATLPRVAGQIVTAAGLPIAGVSVLQVAEVHRFGYRLPEHDVDQRLIRHGARTKTDAQGRFAFTDVPAERIHLSIYGDPILPLIVELSTLENPEQLRLVVQGRHHLEVVLDDPTRADAVAGRDRDGDPVVLSNIRSGSMDQRAELPLHDGRSGVVAVDGRLRTVVLLKRGAVVEEIAVRPQPGKTTVIR